MITVFTPTYNRRNTLERLYESLKKQDTSDFEWLIVDDGSIDDTEDLIQEYKKDAIVNIEYIKVENGGKPAAYNIGLENAKGEIFFCVDSDDMLEENVLFKVEEDFKKLSEDCCGICYLCADMMDKNIIGTKFPEDVKKDYYYNIYNRLGVKGDKCMVFKTNIAKEYPFPIIDKEKFISEALVFNRIAKKYMFELKNDIVKLVEYLDTGYSNNYFNLVKNNPKSNMLYLKELYEFQPTLYNVAAYDMFGIYSQKGFVNTVKEHPSKFKACLMYIPAWIKYIQKGK